MARFQSLFIVFGSLIATASAFGSAGVTYHGRLMKPDGTPVSSSNVQFRVQIRTPGNENCLMYEEIQVKDLSSSNGIFALTINDGSATVVNTEPFTLDRLFQNRGTFAFGTGKCTGASTYVPSATDGRRLAVDFNDGSFSGWESVPTQAINFVPMALETMTVGGYNASNLLRVVDGSGSPTTVSPLTQTQHDTLLELVNGTSTLYRGGAANVPATSVTGNIAGNAAGFTGSLNGDVTGTQSATTVTKIQGRAVDTAAPANGQALVWSAGNSRWEPGTVSGGGSADWSTLTGKPATFSPSAHSHPINEISSGTGAYFNYSPNGTACGAGEILKWDTGGGGRWICGVDAGSAGALASLTVNAPLVKTGTSSDPVLSVSDASTSAKGIVQLASSSDTAAGLAVQADDTRLTDGRTPSGSAGGELAGNYPNPTVVASVSSSASSLVRRSAGGQIQSASADFGAVGVNNGGGSVVTIQTPAAFTSYTLKLPAGTGTNGQILTSNGTDMIWSNASSITASNVSGIVAIANGGTGASNASVARTNLGVTATGDALATAADAAAARAAISAMQNVAPGSNGNVLTVAGGVWTSAPFTVNAANVGSSVGGYFTYKPNNGACANGEVLKWETAGGGRWACGTDISSTGGTGVSSVSATAPVTVDNTDPNNPRVEIDGATTSSTGVVQLATSSDMTAGLVVQADDTRLTNSRAPNGAAGGDLGGNYPNPTIAKLQTKDITLTALANGNVLKYDGTKWVNAADADSLGGLSCSNGDVALYAGGVWSCVAASTTSSNNSVVRRDGSGMITSAGGNFGTLQVNNGTSTITLATPAAFTSYTLKLPSGTGTNGQILTSNGTDMIWSNASSITASNVSGIVAVANGGTGASTASAARTNLGFTATGSSLATAADAATARTAISALSSTDSRLAPTPAAGNALNYVRVNAGGTAYEARTAANVLADIGAMTAVAPGTSGNILISNGTSWASGAVPTDTTKVSKTGDTMSGSLTLSGGTLTVPTNGLVVGTDQLVATGGNIGVGTTAPASLLQLGASDANPNSYLTFGKRVPATETNPPFLGQDSIDSTANDLGMGPRSLTGGINFYSGWSAAPFEPTSLRMRLHNNGNLGVGTASPTAVLHLKAGTAAAGTAPLKLTAGTVLSTPEPGAIEFDGTNLYYTDSTNTRKTVGGGGGGGGPTLTGITSVANAGGNITLSPTTGTGTVLIDSGAASVGSASGALVVTGGVGVSGAIYSGGSINAGTSVTAATSMFTPQLYGSSSASGNIRIDGTSDASKGNVLLASAGGSVGIGTTNPSQPLHLFRSGSSASVLFETQSSYNGDTYSNSGATYAGTAVDNGAVGTVAWTNPTNGTTSNNLYATAAINTATAHYLVATNFGFSIPANATIWGLSVTWEKKCSSGTSCTDNAVRIVKGGVIGTTDKSSGSAWPSADTNVTYGGPSDLWGLSWTPADINSSNFGAALSAKSTASRTVSIDSVAITVYYSTPNPTVNTTWSVGGDQSDRGSFKIEPAVSVNGGSTFAVTTSRTIGVGTSLPLSKMEIYGSGDQTTANMNDAGSRDSSLALNSSNANNGAGAAITFGNAQSNSSGSIGWAAIKAFLQNGSGNTTGDLAFSTRNATSDTALTERMRITSDGSVGIGTSAPTAGIEVRRSSTNTTSFSNGIYTATSYAPSGTTANESGHTGSWSDVEITGNANKSNSWVTGVGTEVVHAGGGTVGNAMGLQSAVTVDGSGTIDLAVGAALGVYDEAGTINSGFGIYIDHVDGATQRWSIYAADPDAPSFLGAGLIANAVAVGTCPYGGCGTTYYETFQTQPGYNFRMNFGGTERFQFRNDGWGQATAGWTTSSDRRLKKDIQSLTDEDLAKILSLRPVSYLLKDSTAAKGRQIGLIAQEVREVYPEVVREDDTGPHFLSVNYPALVSPLIQAVQEIHRMVSDLFRRSDVQARELATVKEENARLKRYLCAKDPAAPFCDEPASN